MKSENITVGREVTNKIIQTGRDTLKHPLLKELFNNTIMSKLSISMYFNHWVCKEYFVLDYIIKHSKNFKHSGKGKVTMSSFFNSKYTTKFNLTIANTESYILMEDNKTICHLLPVKLDALDNDGNELLLNITFIGKNAYKYMHSIILTIKKHYVSKLNNSTDRTVNITRIKENNIDTISYDLCKFDDVVLANKENIIIKPLAVFFNAEELYSKYKVTYKLGILLYGIPGTGKTTLMRAIINAAMDKFYVYCYLLDLNLKSESLDRQINDIIRFAHNNTFRNSTTDYSKPSLNVIILEEIDSIFPKDRDKCTDSQLEKINTLLQFLDGPLSPPNTIFIATTNRKDKLDEAIIRDGRFSIQINMGNFDKDEAEEMCNKYDVALESIIDIKNEDTIRPATLQKLIFNYIMDKNVLQIKEKN